MDVQQMTITARAVLSTLWEFYCAYCGKSSRTRVCQNCGRPL